MLKKEHKKLQELQVIQASNFLLLSKLFSNLTINNNFRFHLPISSEKERKLSQINFNLKKISKYTSNLEIVMESPFIKKDIKLNLRIYHEAKLAEVTRFQNFHISLLEIFPTNLKFGFSKDERLQWNSFTKEFLNLCLKEGRSIETFVPSWL